ncbi:hypothetical protein BJX99DRAFT_28091 [Aspergillus californicus]
MKIDVHHHFYPPALLAALERAGGDPSGWYIPPWTLDFDRNISHLLDLRTTILSVTAPGPCIEKNPIKAAALARTCNEYAASIRDAQPSQYGFFASVPCLFNTNTVLDEIDHAYTTLHADGVTLFTRYGDGHTYLGNPIFKPIWADLSKRETVVFIHPTHPVDTSMINPYMPQPMFNYPHETGRAAMDLLTNGILRDYPGCKIILSHAGGTLPYLIYRAATMMPLVVPNPGLSTEEIVAAARAFYFDTAISANPVTLKALFEFAEPGHVLFGSDFPNAPTEAVLRFTRYLEAYDVPQSTKRLVESEAALALFPRLQAREGVARI